MDILGPGLSLLVWVNYWHEFLQSKAHPDDLIDGHKKGHTWRERFESGFIAQDVGIGLTLDIPPQITYRFKSLISALETMFILSIGSKSNQIKLCQAKDCNRPFLATNPRSLYCSSSCLSRDKVRNKRARDKAAQKTVVKTEVELSTKPKKTQGKSRKA
jgi:hypothetical protein